MSYPQKKYSHKNNQGEVQDFTFHGRVPPNSSQAEESVLGGILIDNEMINAAMEILRPEDFYRSAHRSLFQGMIELVEKRQPVDTITLSQQLRSMGLLEDAGGLEYISRLSAVVPSSANVAYYAKVVKEMAMRQNIIHQSSEIIAEAFNAEGEVEDFIDSVEQRIFKVSEFRADRAFHRVGDVVKDSIKHVELLYDRKELVTGVPTGFDDLNKITAGFQPSDLIILAARPAMGKTSLALSVAQYVGIHAGMAVAVFSLEMSKEQLVLRMLCSEGGVNGSKVRTGHLGERDFPRLVEAASRIAEAPIFIDDTPALSVMEMRAKARRLHREHPLSLIVVDYLQLMKSPTYANSREQEISDISRSLKALAKELSIPVIALSQLNRSVEQRNDKRPMMSDLRESGAIEQDADLICFIYRDEVYNQDSEDKGVAELIIAKQRSGPTGVVRLAFMAETTRFHQLEERREEPEIASLPLDDGFIMPDGNDDLF
ncbi:MAG: replicative DNA helicase [Bdellovibrionales bacterium]|nr:replicative DNA helicase [Bdellovibrionales bacterium]